MTPYLKAGDSSAAGTSSGTNDGAGVLVAAVRDKGMELGMKPMVQAVSFAAAGVDPNYQPPAVAADRVLLPLLRGAD